LSVPPLRERREDIEVLARYFLEQFMREIPTLRGKRLSKSALAALRRHRFPGNLRELKNVIERAAYRETGDEIGIDDLGPLPDGAGAEASGRGSFDERVEAYERRLVDEAMREARSNQAQAARLLGLSYHQLRYYARKFGVK